MPDRVENLSTAQARGRKRAVVQDCIENDAGVRNSPNEQSSGEHMLAKMHFDCCVASPSCPRSAVLKSDVELVGQAQRRSAGSIGRRGLPERREFFAKSYDVE